MKNDAKFELKKCLLVVLCCIILTTFVGNLCNVIVSVFYQAGADSIAQMQNLIENPDSNLDNNKKNEIKAFLYEIGSGFKDEAEMVKENIKETKEILGEDFPEEGLFLFRITTLSNLENTIITFNTCFIIGLILGLAIYIIAFQKAKNKKFWIEIIISAVVVLGIISIELVGYNLFVNFLLNQLTNLNEVVWTVNSIEYITELTPYSIILIFIVIFIVVGFVNAIKQNQIAKKLNKELEKKNKID